MPGCRSPVEVTPSGRAVRASWSSLPPKESTTTSASGFELAAQVPYQSKTSGRARPVEIRPSTGATPLTRPCSRPCEMIDSPGRMTSESPPIQSRAVRSRVKTGRSRGSSPEAAAASSSTNAGLAQPASSSRPIASRSAARGRSSSVTPLTAASGRVSASRPRAPSRAPTCAQCRSPSAFRNAPSTTATSTTTWPAASGRARGRRAGRGASTGAGAVVVPLRTGSR